MPARPPPRPPMARNQRKPPVPPPRRRLVRDVDPSLSAKQGLSSISILPASTQVVSNIGSQTEYLEAKECQPSSLVSLQHVPDPISRRASTGDLAVGNTHPMPQPDPDPQPCHNSKADFCRKRPRRGLQHLSPGVAIPLGRPASTPELKASASKPAIPPPLSEPDSQESSPPADNRTTVRFSDERCDIREALLDTRVLEVNRIRDICESWNLRQWVKAEGYLTYHLSTLNASPNSERARRIRHLLGVCASYRGHWQRALDLFISVLRTPVEDTRKLDNGDRAALYWLADTYALLGRRGQALLAYCFAGSCRQLASGAGANGSWRCLLAEQKQLLRTVSNADFNAVWADDSFRTGRAAAGQLLHSSIISQAMAEACLQACSVRAEEDCEVHDHNQSSANQTRQDKPEWHQILISPIHFEPGQIWPMAHDITFSTSNVTQGRFFPAETDLLKAAQTHPETILPRQTFSFPISRTVSARGLTHLLPALRETLQTLSMGWSEVLKPRDVSFLVAYTAIEDNIATVNYFKLEIVRVPSFSSTVEFGLVFCSSSKSSSSARKTSGEQSRIGQMRAAAATKRAVKNCLRTTLASVY